MTYAAQDLLAEVAYLGERLHWSLESLLGLEHGDRRRFLELVLARDPDHIAERDRR